MITLRKLTISAVATLGLSILGAVNSANAAHPLGGRELGHGPVVSTSGHPLGAREMGHGPVVNSSGKIGKESGKCDNDKCENDRKGCEHRYWNSYTNRYEYLPACSYPAETCASVCEVPVAAQPVCEVPVCPEPVLVPTTCYDRPCSYEYGKRHEFHKPCDLRRGVHPLDGSKPTTASSHRNTENLGSTGSRGTASLASNGRGRK